MYLRPLGRLQRDVGDFISSSVVSSYGGARERRSRRALRFYEFEMDMREEGTSDFVYDAEHDLFRFPDGRFAFSRAFADVKLLRERSCFG